MPKQPAIPAISDIVNELRDIDNAIGIDRVKGAKVTVDKKYKALLQRVGELETLLDASKAIADINTFAIAPGHGHESEATAVALFSDVHIEERVDPKTVNNLNEYNLEIASARCRAFFKNVARLIKAKRKSIRINNLVLALLGDFITNDIHEELAETALLTPIEATRMAQDEIASGIEYLLKSTKDLHITLPCHSGNHARTTRKVRHSTEAGHSLEYFMYHSLANHFKGEPRVAFAIAPGYMSISDICGFLIRWHHGHNIRYAGGVGGITIPVRKAISQWNKFKTVHLDGFAHHHQLLYCGNFIGNGSLIGYSAFAQAIKADYEDPKQAFFLVHHGRRELIDFCPVWLD